MALAVFVGLALAMMVHLTWIQASGEVAGAGAFLLIMWLGIPALAPTIGAAVNSIRALDRALSFLTAHLALLILVALLGAPPLVVAALAIIYIMLVSSVALSRWRHRNRAKE